MVQARSWTTGCHLFTWGDICIGSGQPDHAPLMCQDFFSQSPIIVFLTLCKDNSSPTVNTNSQCWIYLNWVPVGFILFFWKLLSRVEERIGQWPWVSTMKHKLWTLTLTCLSEKLFLLDVLYIACAFSCKFFLLDNGKNPQRVCKKKINKV